METAADGPVMRWLLDTNYLSELRKSERANRGVLAWSLGHDPVQAAVSVVSVGEIRKGIENKRRTDLPQARALAEWFAGVLVEFETNILPVTIEIAQRWGLLLSKVAGAERDMLIAATALEHDLTLVTRNVSDFAGTGVRVVNPWK